MRLSECVFHLQEMAAASRKHIDSVPTEEEVVKVMLVQALALEMAAEKLSAMLPKAERDEAVQRRKAN